ncbi:hypothetical protein M3Y97_01040800 [Aphelenchoides bicaudatus]|nr:hypothetical protein M3Y97_01040800 [Aphelenchoides bicaudatus]
MQAHFKSYTCTLCSKEITSNETLRAHMLKQHQISRMFMCRCCNWAFPDKTSLHMHMQLQGKPDQREAANVPVIGKSNQPDTSVTPNALNNNNKPSNDPPLLLPNALFSTGQQPQLNGLFPPMPIDSLLNLNTLQQQAQAQQSQIPSIFKPAGLFPQLSMMRGDNVDLLSKLRQRLFLTSMWAQQQNQQKAFMPGQEKMLADFLENNNQLLSEQAPIGQSLNPQQVAMTSSPPNNAETDKARQNLAQLMDMLQRNAENNNNNSVKTNMNTEEADSNNNNNNSSTDQFKSNQVEDEDNLNSVEIDEDDFENEIGEVPLNFVTPTLNQQQNSSIVSNNEQLNNNAHFLQKQNANMEKMIQEIRVKLNAFLEKEKLTTEQKEFLFSLLTKLE